MDKYITIKEISEKYKDYAVKMRRTFHQIPEIRHQEYNTSKIIKQQLTDMSIDWYEYAGTGVMGIIKSNNPGKVIALRADMDALEVQENVNLDYKSKTNGLMHACGHDGHMAMLLTAARMLIETKHEFNGTIKLIFQPAEEGGNGAHKMIEEGVMKDVEGIFGIHLWPDLNTGKVSAESGPRLASADFFDIDIKGFSGHGSMPHKCIDSVVVGSAIVNNIQALVSREINPLDPVVITIGTFQSGTRNNIIASDAKLTGTTRTFSNELRQQIPSMMERVIKSTVQAHKAEAVLKYYFGSPPVINDIHLSHIAQNAIVNILGEEGIANVEKTMGGEDFSEYTKEAPGAMMLVGTRNDAKFENYPLHHGSFQIDEDSLIIGACLYMKCALDFLK